MLTAGQVIVGYQVMAPASGCNCDPKMEVIVRNREV